MLHVLLDSDEYNLESVSPSYGTLTGGTQLTIDGSGFNTNFFEGGNYVSIASALIVHFKSVSQVQIDRAIFRYEVQFVRSNLAVPPPGIHRN